MGHDRLEDLLYEAHNLGIVDRVLDLSRKDKRHYYTYADKIQIALNKVKEENHEKNKNNSKK
jgi:hypothetical protein